MLPTLKSNHGSQGKSKGTGADFFVPSPLIMELHPQRLASNEFVGRAQEMEELRAGLENMLMGQGRLVLLGGDPEQERFRFFDSFTAFLKNVATRQPLVLFVAVAQELGMKALEEKIKSSVVRCQLPVQKSAFFLL